MSQFAAAVTPPELPLSMLGYRRPDIRAAELPGMVSVPVRSLFPDVPEPLLSLGGDVSLIRRSAEEALARVDLSAIKPDDSVNILSSEHGFAMMGGQAYAEMLRTVKDVVEARTGNTRLRLAFSSAASRVEGMEIIPQFGLENHFGENIVRFTYHDRGVPIETDIGTLYGVKQAYNAQRIIHCHYDCPREVHFHRINGRALKAFAMSFARLETRAIYHSNFPTSSANIVPRALYESKFIQDKFVCAVMLKSSPSGIMGVDAHNDLIELDKQISRDLLRRYGKMIHLFEQLGDCIAVLDGHRWLHYCHGGGLTSCNLFFGPHDHLDLGKDYRSSYNPAVKAVVMNYAWRSPFTLGETPFIASHPEVAQSLQYQGSVKNVLSADDLESAMERAYEVAGTRRAIVFDGSYGAINCTPEMAEHLYALAPKIVAEVDEELMPKWWAQRGLGPYQAS